MFDNDDDLNLWSFRRQTPGWIGGIQRVFTPYSGNKAFKVFVLFSAFGHETEESDIPQRLSYLTLCVLTACNAFE